MIWIIYALISALLLSFNSIIQKKILNKEHALQTLVTFTFVASMVMTLFIGKVDFVLEPIAFVLLYLKSALLSFSWILLFKAYRHMEISSVEPMRNLSPLFLVFLAVPLLGERLSILNFLGILVIITGAYVIQVDHSFSHLIKNLKVFHNKHMDKLIISLILISISQISDKILIQDYQVSNISILFYVYWMMFINLFLVFSYKYNGYHGIIHSLQRRHIWIILAVLFKLSSEYMYLKALAIPGVLISLAIPVKRMSTLFTTIIGGEVFHDHGLKTRITGCVIMLLGVILVLLPW